MPETIRTANERLRSRPWRGGFLVAVVTVIFSIVLTTMARAEMRLGATAVDVVRRTVPWLTATPESSVSFTPLHQLDGRALPGAGGPISRSCADHFVARITATPDP